MEIQRASRTEDVEMAAVTTVRPLPATHTRWWGWPFAIFGADLPPNLLLMAKLIVLGLLLQTQLPLSNRFLPFFPFLDRMGSPAVFHGTLVLVFLIATTALFLNWRVRAASTVLGLT